MKRAVVPVHLSNHPVFVVPNLIPHNLSLELLDLMKEYGEFHSNVDQSKAQGFKPLHDDIGESQPINDDGSCNHKFLFPNIDKTKCHLPQRVDIGKHFIMTGGLDGTKEYYKDLVDRVSSFGKYNFIDEMNKNPAVKHLFESEHFQNVAKSVCPNTKQTLDPFQFNYIIQVPGQTVALHIDSPYFWNNKIGHANRYSFPQWFLVAMVFSNLFKNDFIDQVQVVGYLHQWEPELASSLSSSLSSGGEFVWYNNDTSYESTLPLPLSGSVVDGSKVFHASKIYKSNIKAPHLNKNKDSSLRYLGNDIWEVQSNNENIKNYTTNDLRISIVYRARCFKDESEIKEYINDTNIMNLNDIFNIFINDLINKGKLQKDKIDTLNRLDLAFLIIDTYIIYPLPPIEYAIIPYNYCAITLLLPSYLSFLNNLLYYFCK